MSRLVCRPEPRCWRISKGKKKMMDIMIPLADSPRIVDIIALPTFRFLLFFWTE